ncbi:putative ribonuclease H-like domain-containing protein [Tanacetum coccineum]
MLMMALMELKKMIGHRSLIAGTCTLGHDGLMNLNGSNKVIDALVSLALMVQTQRYLSDKSCIGFGVESSSSKDSDNSSGSTNSTESLYTNIQKTKGFHSVPPPTGTIIPPRANVSFTGIDELAIRNKVLNQENTNLVQPEIDRISIIEDWVDSDDEETDVSEIQKNTVFSTENSKISFENKSPNSQHSIGQESRTKGLGNKGGPLTKEVLLSQSSTYNGKDEKASKRDLKDYAFIDSGCSGKYAGDKDKLSDFKEFKGGGKNDVYILDLKYIIPSGGSLFGCKAIEDEALSYGTERLWHVNFKKYHKLVKRQSWNQERYSIASDHSTNGVAVKEKNRDFIEACFRTMLADSLLPIQFWAEAVNTACYVLNRVLVTKPQMKTPYEILMGRSPNISFMRPLDGHKKGSRLFHVNFLEIGESKGEKVLIDVDLEILTPSEFLSYVQQFIVHGPNIHAAQNKPLEEYTAEKTVPLSLKKQVLYDELREPESSQALADESWVEKQCKKNTFNSITSGMGVYVILPEGKRQEEGVDYDEVFAPVARIEAIRLFLAFASFMGFIVYQMDVKSAFLYGNITEEVRINFRRCQYLGRTGLLAMQETNNCGYSSTRSDYVAAASCCARICFSSKTKHIQNRNPSFEDSYEKGSLNGGLRQSYLGLAQRILATEAVRGRVDKTLGLYTIRFTSPYKIGLVTALAAVEEHILVLILGCKFCKDAKGTPTKVCSFSTLLLQYKVMLPSMVLLTPLDSDEVQGIDTLQGTAAFYGLQPLRPIQVMESEEQLKVAEVLVAISRPRGLETNNQPQQPSQATDPTDKGKGILVEEPKKKKLTLQQIRA